MKIHCKYDALVPIRDLKPYAKNRNKHPKEQIERLAKILGYQGQRAPIIVGTIPDAVSSEPTDPRICKGHGTADAIALLGEKNAAVVYQHFENEDQRYAFVQSDNAIANWAELDLAGINADLAEMGPFDIDLLGIEDFTVDVSEHGDGGEDAVPEPPKVAKTKPGELWVLGKHRLLCGDSTKREDVERLMAGEKADMVFTDPPYGIDLDTDYTSMGDKAQKHRAVHGDNKNFDASEFAYLDTKEQFWFGANYYIESFRREYGDGSWFVWDKYPTDQNDKRFGSLFELVWSKQRHKQVIVRVPSLNVGHYKPEDIVHPTQKPSALVVWFLERYSEFAQAVLDLFLGSGSTLIACEKTNRRCFGMEIDPLYCDVILDRFQKFSGVEPKREDGTPWSYIRDGGD
jgi:DNA modification methylase